VEHEVLKVPQPASSREEGTGKEYLNSRTRD
jgi:hypothetical protein